MEPLAGVSPLNKSAKILELHLNMLRETNNLSNGGHDLLDDHLICFCKGVFETLEAYHGPNPTRMVLQRCVSEGKRGHIPFEQISPDEEDFKTLDLFSLRLGETLEKPVDPS